MNATGVFWEGYRVGAGYSHHAVARRTGISHARVFKIERGYKSPRPEEFAALADLYELDEQERLRLRLREGE